MEVNWFPRCGSWLALFPFPGARHPTHPALRSSDSGELDSFVPEPGAGPSPFDFLRQQGGAASVPSVLWGHQCVFKSGVRPLVRLGLGQNRFHPFIICSKDHWVLHSVDGTASLIHVCVCVCVCVCVRGCVCGQPPTLGKGSGAGPFLCLPGASDLRAGFFFIFPCFLAAFMKHCVDCVVTRH